MRVTHVSTSDVSGGAAIAAFRLHAGLKRSDIDSCMFVQTKRSNSDAVYVYDPQAGLAEWPKRTVRRARLKWKSFRYLRNRPPGFAAFTTDRTVFCNHAVGQLPPSDILNLHWIAGFMDYNALLSTSAGRVPIVWTLHDMNPLTGGCHYASGCHRFRQQCGNCPQLAASGPNDYSRQIWTRKSRAFNRIASDRLHIVTPSRWLGRHVQESALLGAFPVSVIPNGLDTAVFAPQDRGQLREALGIPNSAEVVLFGAESLERRRKGVQLLLEALRMIPDRENLWLVSFGRSSSTLEIDIPYQHVGIPEDERSLASLYAAADVFVLPSLEDNLPNTVMEALACGTPVIGFDVGGVPDMVRPDMTGFLAPAGDVAALANAITTILEEPVRLAEMSANCRRIACAEYALHVQANRYIELYQTLLAAPPGRDSVQ